jgi:phytanoyl-CoA hydroxylase
MAGSLTPAQISFYADNGYILLKGVFTKAEMAEARLAMQALTERLMPKRKQQDSTWGSVRSSQTMIYHCHDVQFHSALATRLICDPRFTAPLQSIVGENVQLHHTKMFIKPPEKGSPFPLHQDYPYFPHTRHTMTAATIHFDDAPLAKGCMRVIPGSHQAGPRKHDNTGDHHLPFEDYPIESAVPCEAEAGDVLVFNYLTIHGSGVNTSQEARTTMLVQIRDPLDKPLVRAHESTGQGMMLAGIDPSCAYLPEWERESVVA